MDLLNTQSRPDVPTASLVALATLLAPATVALATLLAALGVPATTAVPGDLARIAIVLTTALLATVATAWRAASNPAGERGPWCLLSAAALAFAGGTTLQLVAELSDTSVASVTPGPGPHRLLHVVALALLAGAIAWFRHRRSGPDVPSLVDAAAVGAVICVTAWAVLVAPTLQIDDAPLIATAVLLLLPLAAIAVITVTWRLVLQLHRAPPAELALVVGAGLTCTATVISAASVVSGQGLPDGPIGPVGALALGFFITTALHPSAAGLTTRDPARPSRSPARRVASLAMATLLLPAALVATADGAVELLTATVTGAVLLALTVRVLLLLRALERTRHTELAMQRHRDEQRFHAMAQHATEVLLVLGRDGSVNWASPSATALFGCDPVGWSNERMIAELHDDEHEATLERLSGLITPGGHSSGGVRVRLRDHDAAPRFVDVSALDLRSEPDVGGIVLTIRDATRQTLLEQELRHLAFHDPLTGLANRDLFQQRLAHAVAAAARTGDHVAVILCDLDDFKDVNDTLGHPMGDALLRELGDRFARVTRATDTVARIGGDEFAVLCEDLTTPREAVMVARRLIAVTQEPILVDGHELRVGISVGIAVDDGTRSGDELLRDADVALYEAKDSGKQNWSLHRPSMTARTLDRNQLAVDLARDIDAGRLDVAYQPIVSLTTDEVVGAEALVRWEHPTRGQIPPEVFVGLAERTGLVGRLGAHVLGRALEDLSRWDAAGVPRLRLGVNVSARQLLDRRLVDQVAELLARHEVRPDRLVLELTESVMLEDAALAMEVIEGLRAIGVRFALDDFGTGFSSLSYLHRLPVDIVKIDRSFVRDMTVDPSARDLVRAIIDLGTTLHLDVVAEGIETRDQRDQLRALGCAFGQGYLYSRPVPSREVVRSLTRPMAAEGPPAHHGQGPAVGHEPTERAVAT